MRPVSKTCTLRAEFRWTFEWRAILFLPKKKNNANLISHPFWISQPAPSPKIIYQDATLALTLNFLTRKEWTCTEAAWAQWEEKIIPWQLLRQLSTVPVVLVHLPQHAPFEEKPPCSASLREENIRWQLQHVLHTLIWSDYLGPPLSKIAGFMPKIGSYMIWCDMIWYDMIF